nr:MAG TPA: hypothetical protein [Caudoviricetes sp.]
MMYWNLFLGIVTYVLQSRRRHIRGINATREVQVVTQNVVLSQKLRSNRVNLRALILGASELNIHRYNCMSTSIIVEVINLDVSREAVAELTSILDVLTGTVSYQVNELSSMVSLRNRKVYVMVMTQTRLHVDYTSNPHMLNLTNRRSRELVSLDSQTSSVVLGIYRDFKALTIVTAGQGLEVNFGIRNTGYTDITILKDVLVLCKLGRNQLIQENGLTNHKDTTVTSGQRIVLNKCVMSDVQATRKQSILGQVFIGM